MELINKNLKVSRRDFGRYIGLTAFLPLLSGTKSTIPDLQNSTVPEAKTQSAFDTITGRMLTEEEKHLVAKFFEGYDKLMANIKGKDLPVDLAPAFLPKYPNKKK